MKLKRTGLEVLHSGPIHLVFPGQPDGHDTHGQVDVDVVLDWDQLQEAVMRTVLKVINTNHMEATDEWGAIRVRRTGGPARRWKEGAVQGRLFRGEAWEEPPLETP